MGIPQLFSKIVQDNPDLISAPADVKKLVHSFFLDYNALVYQVWHCIQQEEHPNERQSWKEPEWEQYLIDEVVRYTCDLIAWVHPTNRVVISIDGVVPRAKIEQQRHRRYKIPWIREYESKLFTTPVEDDKIRPVFDTAKITVGTPFWGNMVSGLINAVKMGRMTPSYGQNRGITPLIPGQQSGDTFEIEIHDAQTKGEGEHKIIANLLANPVQNQVLIYGLDADLLLLTLRASLVCPNIAILRESTTQRADQEAQCSRLPKWNTPFFWVDISKFRGHWVRRITTLAQENPKNNLPRRQNPQQWTHESLIADAMVLYCFVGNDFLPQQPSLEIQEGGIDNLWRSYGQVRMFRNDPWSLVDLTRQEIRWEFLFELVKRLYYAEIHQCKYLQNRRRMKSRSRRANIDEETGLPILFDSSMTLDDSKFQWERIWGNEHLRSCYEWTDWTHPQAVEQYHKIHFHWEANQMTPEFTRSHYGQRVCRDYLRMLDFVFQYYWRETPCWVSYYPYGSVPLFVDLYNYLEQTSNYGNLSWKPTIEIPTALGQGLWVLTPEYSAKLIPEKPKSYKMKDAEAPNRTSLHGADRYMLMTAEPNLPPARWTYWNMVVKRDGDSHLLETHPIRKFKVSLRK